MVISYGNARSLKVIIKSFFGVIIFGVFAVVFAQSGVADLGNAVNAIESDVRNGLMGSILGLLGAIVVITVGVRVIWLIMQR